MDFIPVRVGIEQQINTTTIGAQVLARFTISVAPAQLASLPNGVIAVYEGLRGGVYMRAAYADGSLSSEVFVNNATSASVAVLGDGEIVVINNEDYGPSGNILARVYNSDLTPKSGGWANVGVAQGSPSYFLGGIFQRRVFAPSIVALHPGNRFAVIWHRGKWLRGARTRLLCRFFKLPHHAPTIEEYELWGTNQFMFNTTNQSAALDGGGFVFVNRNDDGWLSIGIFNTQDQRTDWTKVNAKGTFPCIASYFGLCVVAWRSDADGDIYVAYVNASDAPLASTTALMGAPAKANQQRGDLTRPAITFLKSGGYPYHFVVAWEKKATMGAEALQQHASRGGIKARLFTMGYPQCIPECDEFSVNTTLAGQHAAPSIAATPNTAFYAIWMANSGQAEDPDSADRSDWGIKGQEWVFAQK